MADDALSDRGTGRHFTVPSPDAAVCAASAKNRHGTSTLSSSFPPLVGNERGPLPISWSRERRRRIFSSEENEVVVPSSTRSRSALTVASSRRASKRPNAPLLPPPFLLDGFWPYFRFGHSPSKSRERDDDRRLCIHVRVHGVLTNDDAGAGTNADDLAVNCRTAQQMMHAEGFIMQTAT